jgi:MFS family permease
VSGQKGREAGAGKPIGPADFPPERRLLPAILFPVFLATFDQTIVAAALPAMSQTLGSIEALPWLLTSYLMANTIAAPIYGRLGDALGRRRMMFWALGLFLVASIGCAIVRRFDLLLLMRILQGLGGGGLMTLSQAMIGESMAPRRRGIYQGYVATVAVVSNAIGPVAGGILAQRLGWPSIFLINIPLAALAAVFMLRMPGRPGAGLSGRFDYLGAILFTGFISTLSFGLNLLQSRGHGASVATGAAVIGLTLVLLVLLIVRESRLPYALFPIALLRDTVMWRTNALTMCQGAMVLSLITYLPIYLTAAYHEPADVVGFLMLPLTIGIGVGSLLTGRLITSTGRTAIYPTVGLAVVTVLLVLVSVGLPQLGPLTLALAFGAMAFFLGTVLSVAQITAQITAGAERLGAAAGLLQCSRTVGAAVGTALTGAVLNPESSASSDATKRAPSASFR